LIKTDNTERSTRHWSRRNHRVTDTFCNCIEDRFFGFKTFWLDARYPQQATVASGNNYNQRKKIGLIFRSQLFLFF